MILHSYFSVLFHSSFFPFALFFDLQGPQNSGALCLASEMSPTLVLIYLTFDQCAAPWGKVELGGVGTSFELDWFIFSPLSDERLHCYFHFGSLFLISYSNTWQLSSLTCSAAFLKDKSDLFLFSNFLKDTLKLDEKDFPFCLGHGNSLETFIFILTIKTR